MVPKNVLSKMAGEFIINYTLTNKKGKYLGKVHVNSHLMLNQKVVFSIFSGIDTPHTEGYYFTSRSLITYSEENNRFERLWIDNHHNGEQSLYHGELKNEQLKFYTPKFRYNSQTLVSTTYDFSDPDKIVQTLDIEGENNRAANMVAFYERMAGTEK